MVVLPRRPEERQSWQQALHCTVKTLLLTFWGLYICHAEECSVDAFDTFHEMT